MTTATPGQADPRALLGHALDQTERLVDGTSRDTFDRLTPCEEYDVRRLLGHIVAVVRRIAHFGRGGEPFGVPAVITGIADDGWTDAYREARAETDAVWSDDAVLDAMLTLPWGKMPGRGAAMMYVQELTMHGWDLAVSTGQTTSLDRALAEASLAVAKQFLPADPRGGQIPFGPVVPVPETAGPYEQLAGWLGRQPTGA